MKTPSPPPSKKRKLPKKKTPAGRKTPQETAKMTSQQKGKMTKSPHMPTPGRQSPTMLAPQPNKMTKPGPSKKTQIVRKTPATKKTCTNAKKMTPAKTQETMFAFGVLGSNTTRVVKPGCVKEAKMKLEEKIRKEKREKKMEEIRKPLLATLSSKRERQDD